MAQMDKSLATKSACKRIHNQIGKCRITNQPHTSKQRITRKLHGFHFVDVPSPSILYPWDSSNASMNRPETSRSMVDKCLPLILSLCCVAEMKNKIQSRYIKCQVTSYFSIAIYRVYMIYTRFLTKTYQTNFSQKNIIQISNKKISNTFLTNKYHPNFRQRQYQTNFKHNKSTKFQTRKFQQKSLKKQPRYCHGFTKCGGCLYGLAIFICLAKVWMTW